MKPKIIVDADGPVLSLERLRKQCEVVAIDVDSDGAETHPDDDLLIGYLAAAVGMAEDYLGMAIALRTYEIALSAFPRSDCVPRVSLPIELPLPPLVEVISFQDSDDSDGPVDPDTYVIDDFSLLARLVPVGSWPSTVAATNSIRVRYRAGYSSEESDAQPMPKQIQMALLLAVGDWYKNREDTVDAAVETLPNGCLALLRPLRVRMGMA